MGALIQKWSGLHSEYTCNIYHCFLTRKINTYNTSLEQWKNNDQVCLQFLLFLDNLVKKELQVTQNSCCWQLQCMLFLIPDRTSSLKTFKANWDESLGMQCICREGLASGSCLLAFMVTGIWSLWKRMLAVLIQNHGKPWHSCTSVGAFQHGP